MDESLANKVEQLRECISREKDLRCPMEDDFLIRFLNVKDLNVDSAFIALKKYIGLRKKVKIYNPEVVREALQIGMVSALKHPDPQGRRIFFFDAAKWDTKKFPSEELLLAGLLINEELQCNTETQKNGILILHDHKELKLSHVTAIRFSQVVIAMGAVQGSFPMKIRELHMANQPGVFRVLLALAYPVMTQKIKDRLHLHGKSMESLHKSIPAEILPQSLGGNLSDEEAFDHELIKNILAKDAYYKSTADIINSQN